MSDFVATIYKALDIEHSLEIDVAGRPIGLVDGEANPVGELFA